MGGKKKRSMKRAERSQKRSVAPKKAGKEKGVGAAPGEKKIVPRITPPNLRDEKFVAELKRMKVLTPYSVASRFDVRLSIARVLLRELERKGIIEFVSKSRNLRIYKPAD